MFVQVYNRWKVRCRDKEGGEIAEGFIGGGWIWSTWCLDISHMPMSMETKPSQLCRFDRDTNHHLAHLPYFSPMVQRC